MRFTRHKKATALGGALALIASTAAVLLVGPSPAHATPSTSTVILLCDPPQAAPPGTPQVPFQVTVTADPSQTFFTGKPISMNVSSVTVSLDPLVSAGLASQVPGGTTTLGIGSGKVPITALTNASGGSQANTTAAEISGANQPVNTTLGNSFTSGAVTYPTFTSSAAGPGTATFAADGGSAAGFTITTDTLTLGFGSFNNQPIPTGGPLGSCTPAAPAIGSLAANLVDFAPKPVSNTVSSPINVGKAGSKLITLDATDSDGSFIGGTPPSGYRITSISGGSFTVNGNPGFLNTDYPPNSGSKLEIEYDAPNAVGPQNFTFQAKDANNAFGAAGVPDGTGTIHLQVGTPPVQQPINQLVNPGQLLLSCTAPAAPPVVTCPVIDIGGPTGITLNGLQQTTTAPMNTIYVSDNRGDLTLPWSLTAYMVQTSGCDWAGSPIPVGYSINDFCNSTAGTDLSLANNHIKSTNLTLTPTALTGCAPHVGNLNSGATIGSGGTLDAAKTLCSAVGPNAGGTWDVNGQFSLNIPSSVASGLYKGTVEYLVV